MLDLFYFETTTKHSPIPERIWYHVDPPNWSSLERSRVMDRCVLGLTQPQEDTNWDALYRHKTLGAQIPRPCEMPNNSSPYRGKHTKVNILHSSSKKKYIYKSPERYFDIGKVISSFPNKVSQKGTAPTLLCKMLYKLLYTRGQRPSSRFWLISLLPTTCF